MWFILSIVIALLLVTAALNEFRVRYYEVQIYGDGDLLVSTHMYLETKEEAETVRTELVTKCRDRYGKINLEAYILTQHSLSSGLYQAAFEVANFCINCYNGLVDLF